MEKMEKRALVCIDFINEIIDPAGKLAGKGYADFVKEHDTLQNVSRAQSYFRSGGDPVIHVRVGFSPSYAEHPAGSPLFGKAKEFQALTLGEWGTEFAKQVHPEKDDIVLVKHRVSAFFGTGLEVVLRSLGVQQVFLAGVATDLAVEAAAREAHDRDFSVTVLSDCCAAANEQDHASSLDFLRKIAAVKTLDEASSG